MGCFSKKKTPQYSPPPPPKLPTAEELMASAVNTAKTQQPLGYAAREGALGDLAKGTSYYEGFQPTSIEQALGSQHFQNIMPDVEESIWNNLSRSGMAHSPIAARLIGRERGRVGFDVGSYLSNLGNQRGQYSLSSRLGIDPFSITNPLLQAGLSRTGQQADLDYNYAQQLAMSDYMNQMEDYKQKQSQKALYSTLGGLALGGLGGFLMAPAAAMTSASGGLLTSAGLPTLGKFGGAMMGAGIGGTAGSMFAPVFGGSQGPIDLASAIGTYNLLKPQKSSTELLAEALRGRRGDIFGIQY